MSFYNMILGCEPVHVLFPSNAGKHPDDILGSVIAFLFDKEHPEYDDHIQVYTRTVWRKPRRLLARELRDGGYAGIRYQLRRQLRLHVCVVVFRVPERWKDDFAKMKEGRMSEVSDEYKAEVARVYPKLADKIDEMFPSISKARHDH